MQSRQQVSTQQDMYVERCPTRGVVMYYFTCSYSLKNVTLHHNNKNQLRQFFSTTTQTTISKTTFVKPTEIKLD